MKIPNRLMLLSVCLALLSAARADIVPATDDQEEPAIAAGHDGWFVVWADKRDYHATEYDIYGARISRSGEVLDPLGIPICTDPGRQTSPRVAFDGERYLVVWEDDRESTADYLIYQIYGARVTAAGNVLDADGFKLTANQVTRTGPAVASNGNGFFVVWVDWHRTDNAIADIYGSPVSAEGEVANPDGIPLREAALWQTTPHIASANGEYLVTFHNSSPNDIWGLRLAGDGTVLSSAFRISNSGNAENRHGLTSDGQDYFVVWGDERDSPSGFGYPKVYGTLVHGNGEVASPDGVPIATDALYQNRPATASDGNGFLVVWQESNDAHAEMTDLYGATITPDGTVGVPERIGISETPGVQYNPAAAFTGAEGMVVWQDGRSAPDRTFPLGAFDIYGTRIKNEGGVSDPDGILITGRPAEEALPLVRIEATTPETTEGSLNQFIAPGEFTVTRSGDTSQPLPVRIEFTGTAAFGEDYELHPGQDQIVIPAGESELGILVEPLFDLEVEGGETVIAILQPPSTDEPAPGYRIDPEHDRDTVVIHDDDGPGDLPVVSLELITREAMETRIDQSLILWAEFRVHRTGPATDELVVYLNTQQGSARIGADYWLERVEDDSAVRFLPGEQSVTVRLFPIDDFIYEGDETAFFHLLRPPEGTPPAGQYAINHEHSSVSMVIHDNEEVTTRLEFSSPRHSEHFEPGEIIDLRTRIIGPAGEGEWSVDIFDGDQLIGTTRPNAPIWWTDATGGPHELTARATHTDGTTLVAPPILIFVGPGPALPVVKVTANPWKTSEPCPTCLVAPIVLRLQRTGPAGEPLVVYLETDGPASPGEDYEPITSPVEFPPGEKEIDVNLLPLDDLVAEGPEVVRVRLALPPHDGPPTYLISVFHDHALVVINDDEPDAPEANLDIVNPQNGARFPAGITLDVSAIGVYTQGEIGPVEFFAGDQLIGKTEPPLVARPTIPGLPSVHTIHWTNPPAGSHVLTARTRLSHEQWVVSPPVHITLDGHSLPVIRIATIPRPDRAAPEFCPPNADCAYPEFEISRNEPAEEPLRVWLSYGGTASPGHDYGPFPESVVIPAGETRAYVVGIPHDDLLIEGPETIVAHIVPAPEGPARYLADPNRSMATMIIADNDRPSDSPVVRIETTSRIAEESSAPFLRPPFAGLFTISRTGPTEQALSVFIHYSGSASPEDCRELPALITIPAGSASATVQVIPNRDEIPEGLETVVATISNCSQPVIPPCAEFEVDPARQSAVVYIRDNGLTGASVTITKPRNGERFEADHPILIEATAIDLEGYLPVVEFLAGDHLLGMSAIDFIRAPDPGTPIFHEFTWHDASPGPHMLTARATRPDGTVVTSHPVTITVGSGDNHPPHITLTHPLDGSQFPPDEPLEISVEARDPDGYVPRVEFFVNDRKLAEIGLDFEHPPEPGQSQTFAFVWWHPIPGDHRLTARATDDGGEVAGSEPVEITISLPDQLPMVNVIALDAFAAEPSTTAGVDPAVFQVRRFGPTSEPLEVRYSLHGLALPGADYESPPGVAVIPAGHNSVNVVVQPLADDLDEPIEGLILRLEQSDADDARYVIGFPARAVAVIHDAGTELPPDHPSCRRLADGLLHFCFSAEAGRTYRLEASNDLRNWETLLTAPAPGDTFDFIENNSDWPRRFYRLIPDSVVGTDN